MQTLDVYDLQDDFLQDTHRFLAFVGGVGSGKSIAGAARSMLASLGRIGDNTIKAPNTGMIVAPTYNVLRDATIPAFRNMASDFIETMNTSPPINAHMVNGSVIFFRSGDNPELLRGPSLSWFWGDEAALYSKDVWPIMLGRLREFGQLGYAWLTTTPKGRNWLYKEFLVNQRPEYKVFKASTSRNPFLDEEYYLSLREAYQGAFAQQELDGDFVTHEGLIYGEFDRAVHMVTAPPDRQWTQVIAGVDWGYANPGVIVVYGVDGDGNMHGLHEEYQRRRQIGEWVNVASDLQARYNIQTFYCDPAEPGFIDAFHQGGLNALAADNAVSDGIQAVKARLANKRITFDPAFVNTFAEFEQYQWAANTLGIKDQPMKANDHALDATRYACMALANPRITKIGRNPFYDE